MSVVMWTERLRCGQRWYVQGRDGIVRTFDSELRAVTFAGMIGA